MFVEWYEYGLLRTMNDYFNRRHYLKKLARLRALQEADPSVTELPPSSVEKRTAHLLRFAFSRSYRQHLRDARNAREVIALEQRRETLTRRRLDQKEKQRELARRFKRRLMNAILWLFALFGALCLFLMLVMSIFHLKPA